MASNPVQEALQRKDQPDEERMFLDGMGSLKVYKVGSSVVGRGSFKPGWQWSKHVKPIAGTESCQAEHTGVVLNGTMCVRMDDGTEVQYTTGDSFYMAPGHDAWVVGDQTCEMLDFSGASHYAVPHAHMQAATDSADLAARNRQIVMQGYEDFGRGDIEAVIARYTDDIEWIGYESANVPFAGNYHGKEGVRRFFQSLGDSMQALRFEPKQVIAEGNMVAVLGHGSWKLTSNGNEVDSDWCHLFELRDGKVCRFQDFDDSAQFTKAFSADASAMLRMSQEQGRPPLHS